MIINIPRLGETFSQGNVLTQVLFKPQYIGEEAVVPFVLTFSSPQHSNKKSCTSSSFPVWNFPSLYEIGQDIYRRLAGKRCRAGAVRRVQSAGQATREASCTVCSHACSNLLNFYWFCTWWWLCHKLKPCIYFLFVTGGLCYFQLIFFFFFFFFRFL